MVHSYTDSIVTYSFTSEPDSILSSKVEIRRIDSVNLSENEIYYNWDVEVNNWQIERQYNRIFGDSGNLLLFEWFKWNTTMYYMEPFDRSEKEYDQNGLIISDADYKWNHNAEDWKGDEKKIYQRDEKGNDTTMISSVWDWGIDNWRYSKKNVSRYNEDNHLTETEFYDWNWNDSVWLLYDKTRYDYIVNDREEIEMKTISSMDLSDESWHAWRKIEYIYDESGRVLSESTYRMIQSDWEGYTRYEFSYDVVGNVISTVSLKWDVGINDWVGFTKYNYAFDTAGNRTEEIYFQWDQDLIDWKSISKHEWQYEEYGTVMTVLTSYWQLTAPNDFRQSMFEYLHNSSGKDSVTIFHGWDNVEDTLKLSWKSFHYYGDERITDYTSIEELPLIDIVLYPIPVKGLLWIKSEVSVRYIDVFDLKGRCILTANNMGNAYDLSGISSGIYIVRMLDQNRNIVGTRKIIKE